MTKTYEELRRGLKSLPRAEQLQLIAELVERLRLQEVQGPHTSILELQGLGKEIWEGIDAQEYVDRERASWSG